MSSGEKMQNVGNDLEFYKWCRANYARCQRSDDPAIGMESFDWGELEIMYRAIKGDRNA